MGRSISKKMGSWGKKTRAYFLKKVRKFQEVIEN
jgi:hypothetical protein